MPGIAIQLDQRAAVVDKWIEFVQFRSLRKAATTHVVTLPALCVRHVKSARVRHAAGQLLASSPASASWTFMFVYFATRGASVEAPTSVAA